MSTRVRRALTVGSLGATALLTYMKAMRPWTLRWGASDQEVAEFMGGDDIVTKADYSATRGITIDAPPQDVWPWLIQIGSGRAGWYSYDRIDNGGTPSATEIVPELQQLKVGDLIPMVVGKPVGVWVKELEPNRRLLLWDGKGEYTWEWVLHPLGDGRTRLINRLRAAYPHWTSPRMAYTLLATTGDIVMIRKMLRGIKARAERHGATAATETLP